MKHFLAVTFLGVMAAGGAYAEGPVDVTNVNKELITSAEGKTYTIATVVKVDGIAWFDRMREGVDQFKDDTGNDTYMVGPSQADAAAQVQMIENLIAQGVDAICVVPFSVEAVEPVLQKARDKGIVVITHEASNIQNADYDIEAFDNFAYGENLMKVLGEAMGGAPLGITVTDDAVGAIAGAQAVIDFTSPAATVASGIPAASAAAAAPSALRALCAPGRASDTSADSSP